MAIIDIDGYLKTIYFDPNHPAAYGGVDKLYRFVKSDGQPVSKGQIKKWLSKQNVYVKHKPLKRKFTRARVVVPRKFYQFDADTISMTRYDKNNMGFKYILIIVDILSRFAWTHPLKSLTGKEMVVALKTVLSKNPENMRTDGGSEFINVQVSRYLRSQNIDNFQTLNEAKANYVERIIKTIKTKLVKYMHHNETFEWVDVLPKIIHNYNNTYHRSIKMTPSQALTIDNPTLWQMQYGPKPKPLTKITSKPPKDKSPYTFKMGDKVKLSFIRSKFDRAYDQKWTDEVFSITERTNKQNIPQYSVKDWSNDPVRGTFYEAELQNVTVNEDVEYKIEKVLKYRMHRGQRQAFIKWSGWHRKFNSWIDANTIEEKV